jgi:hypothetical protein
MDIVQNCDIILVKGIHKRTMRFQKLIKNVFLTLHCHNLHCQQWEMPTHLTAFLFFLLL